MTTTPADTISAYRWLLAWIVLGIFLGLITQLKVGYTVVYYLAVLVLAFILLTQYQAIGTLLQPFTTVQGGPK